MRCNRALYAPCPVYSQVKYFKKEAIVYNHTFAYRQEHCCLQEVISGLVSSLTV